MARLWLLLGTSTWVLTLAIAVLTLGSGAALADDEEDEGDYARTGAYVRGAGQLAAWTSKAGFFPAPQTEWQPDFGVEVALGWRNSERLALEAVFEWVINHNNASFGHWLLGVNGKFFFLEGRVQPYMVAGANGMWAKVPGGSAFQDDWAFRNGLGVDYYLDDHWAITAESAFVWGVGDLWKNYFVTASVGVMYRF